MPAERHTRKANTPKRRRQFEHVQRSALARGASRSSAVRQANAAVKRSFNRSRRRRSRRSRRY